MGSRYTTWSHTRVMGSVKGHRKRERILACVICSKSFVCRNARALYCSSQCYWQAHRHKFVRKFGEKTCAHCPKVFKPISPNQLYCSHKCKYTVQNSRIPRHVQSARANASRQKRREHYNAKAYEWRANNAEAYLIGVRARRLKNPLRYKLLDAAPYSEEALFRQKCEYYGWCCLYCRKPLDEATITIEHKIPRSRGGSNRIANLGPACSTCNYRKQNKSYREFMLILAKERK